MLQSLHWLVWQRWLLSTTFGEWTLPAEKRLADLCHMVTCKKTDWELRSFVLWSLQWTEVVPAVKTPASSQRKLSGKVGIFWIRGLVNRPKKLLGKGLFGYESTSDLQNLQTLPLLWVRGRDFSCSHLFYDRTELGSLNYTDDSILVPHVHRDWSLDIILCMDVRTSCLRN